MARPEVKNVAFACPGLSDGSTEFLLSVLDVGFPIEDLDEVEVAIVWLLKKRYSFFSFLYHYHFHYEVEVAIVWLLKKRYSFFSYLYRYHYHYEVEMQSFGNWKFSRGTCNTILQHLSLLRQIQTLDLLISWKLATFFEFVIHKLILNYFHHMAKLTFNSYSSNLTYIFLLSSDRMIQVQSIWKIVRSVWRRNPLEVWWESWGSWKSYWLLIFLSVPYVFLRYVKRSWRKMLQLVLWFSSSSILCILISFWDLYFVKKKEQIKLL